MNKTNIPSPLSFLPSIPTTAPTAGTGPDINKESLLAAANRDDASMKELLRGSGERSAQVDRVRLALGVLQSDMPESKKEEKARIARAARELIDEHLPAVKTELQAGASIALTELEKKMQEARTTAVLEERGTMNTLSVEAITYDTNEIVRELKGGDWKTWAMYGGVAVGAGLAAKWVWDHTIGWLWSKTEGTKEEPGFLRKVAGWLTAVAGAGAAAVGFHYWKMNGSKFSATGNAAIDIPTGMANVVGTDIMRMATLLEMDAKVLYELWNSENWEKFWEIIENKGGHIAWEHGKAVVTILGEGITMPLQFGQKLVNRIMNGKWDKDTWLVYGQAGAAYFISKQVLQGILRGNAKIPLNIVDGITTVIQMGAWPADMANDIIQAGRTYSYAGGAKGLMLRYVAPTWVSRNINWLADTAPDCSTTKGIESALQRWKQLETYCDVAKKSPDFFEDDIVKLYNQRREKLAAQIHEEMKSATLADDAPEFIKDLKRQTALGGQAFEAEMDKAIIKGNLAPSPEAADDFAKAATKAAGTMDEGLDAAAAGTKATTTVDDGAKAATEGLEDGTKTAAKSADATTDAARTAETGIEQGDEWARAAAKARQLLAGSDATPEAIKIIDDSILKCKALGMGADDAIKAVQDANVLRVLSKTPQNQLTKLAIVIEGGDSALNMRRVCSFLGTFADELDDAAKAAILLDKNLLRMVANSGLDAGDIADMLKNSGIRAALLEGKDVEKLMKNLIWWKNAQSLHTIINVGGAVISAAMLVNDIRTLVDRRKQLTETIARLGADLQQAGFEKDGTEYVHKTTKKRIAMSVIESDIDNMSNPQWLRVAGSGIGTLGAVGTLAFPAMAVNPAVGLSILAIELTVQGAATVWEDQSTREFLRDTPTSVLSVLNLNKVIQKDSKAVLDDASTWMWSDALYMFHGAQNEQEKQLLRKKAVSIMFFQELKSLAKESPDVAMQILKARGKSDTEDPNATLDAGSFLDEQHGTYWTHDFDAVVKPFLAARLFQMSKDSDVKWNQFRDLKIDEGVKDFENISPADMRLALRETAHVYAQYLKQKDYFDEKKTYGGLAALPQQEKVTTVSSIQSRAHQQLQLKVSELRLKQLGGEAVFGKKIAELDDGTGITAVEKYLTDLMARLDGRATVTNAEQAKFRASLGEGSVIDPMVRYGLAPTTGGASTFLPVMPVDWASKGDERALMGKKEIFTGTNPGATGNVRLEDVAGISGRGLERPITEAEMQAIIAKGRDLYGELEGVGTAMKANSVWYAQPSHFQQLKEYSYTLQRDPTLAKEKSVEVFLQKIKKLSEGFSWEDGTLGSDFLAKRNDAFRDALAALRGMNKALDARTYHIAKVERGNAYVHVVCRKDQTTNLYSNFYDGYDSMRGDPSTMYVECNGETVAHTPPPGQSYERPVPGGLLICEQKGYMQNGTPAYKYKWSFKRGEDAKPGTELYMYFKKDGADQPGSKVSLPEVKTVQKTIRIDRALVLESVGAINGMAELDLTYVNASGETVHANGKFHQIIQDHPIGWKRIGNTDPKTQEKAEWLEFVPKDGITLVSCKIDYLYQPQSTLYTWTNQKPGTIVSKQPKKKVSRAA